MSKLFDYQEIHKENLVKILTTHGKALDVSRTGSGKSVTGLHVYKEFKHLPLTIICPPTLIPSWKKHCARELFFENVKYQIFSSHQLKKIRKPSGFLLVDECHDFKNAVKRTRVLRRLVEKMDYSLLMSATPIDDTRQQECLEILLGNIEEKQSKMEFDYKTKIDIRMEHFILDKEGHQEYIKGYNYIRNAATGVQHADHFEAFVPEFFTMGLRTIHSVLFPVLLNYLKDNMIDKKKYIIVMRYQQQFDDLKDVYPNLLILNGKTLQKDRTESIRLFQEDPTRKMIAISELVGGLGVELDDTTGEFPREIVMLPTSNGVNFTQIIGRVQRTNTKSDSVVHIIQPNRNKTYFKGQMSRKTEVMNQFNVLPKFQHHIHCVCPEFDLLGKDVDSIIFSYLCDCSLK